MLRLVVTLITISSILIIGLLTFLNNPKNNTNRFFALFSLFISGWILSVYLLFAMKNSFWGDTAFAVASIIPFLFFVFSTLFPKKIYSFNFITYFLLFLVSLIFAILSFTKLIIQETVFLDGGAKAITGPFYIYFTAYFFSYAISSFYILGKKIVLLKGIAKTQVKYVFWGIIIFAILAVVTNLVLPIFGVTLFSWLGPFFSVLMIVSISYAIIKHRLMDIRLVVARSVAYTVLIVVLAGMYAGGVLGLERIFFPEITTGFNLAQGALRVAITLIVVFSFQPLRTIITRITDKIFFKGRYDPQKLLDHLGDIVRSTIILIELLYKVTDTLIKEMRITRAVFVLIKDGKIYETQAAGYKVTPEFKYKEIFRLAKKEMVVYDELEEGSRLKNMLRRYEAAISVPLKTETEVEGVLLLGEKSSGDMYSTQDIQVLSILAPEMAVAIQNAEAYEKLSRWNVTLRAEVKRQTRKLEEANEHLKELDKAKDEFISMASHQLRTPLTAIKGYLSMLMEGDAGEIKISQYDFINEAFQGANRMVGLINDLLNVSRMETGRFFLEPVSIDLKVMIQEEINQLIQHAKDRNIYLKFEHKEEIPKIEVDENKVRQVVMNFIDNAIYYTKQGGVTVKLYQKGEEIFFEVHDTGIGVPETQKKNLFSKFYRADNARRVRPDGTGLGLYLAKKVVEDHGGEIIFDSVEEKGSVFGFRMPIKTKIKKESTTPPTAGALEAQMKGKKVDSK